MSAVVRARRPWASAIEASAFVRKELTEAVRQPRLLLVLVLGPFALLLLFGVGYDDTRMRMRTLFVGPPGEDYQQVIDRFGDRLDRWVDVVGFTGDPLEANRALRDGRADVVIVFPEDAADTVMAGEHATIGVIHDKIDPLQRATVDLAARLAVGEVNATLLAEVVGEARDSSGALLALLSEVRTELGTLAEVDPAVLVRPFTSETTSLVNRPITERDFFVPSAVALLTQHLVLTFGALSLIRDRNHGLVELLRVGPISASGVLAGKYAAHLALGAVVSAALLVAVIVGLDVPSPRALTDLAAPVALLLFASLSLGLAISMVSRTDSQAVQFAMLSLLAGLFFGGFFLDVSAISYPVRALSWFLPVTHGISALQDVMLRGVSADWRDLGMLALLGVCYGVLAALLLRRQLRSA